MTLRLVARRPRDFPEGGWRTDSGAPFGLEAAGTDWYRPLPLALNPRVMREGFTLTSGKFALSYEPSLAIPFRATFEPVSGWLSARQATAVEEHLVLAHASVADELREFFRWHAQGHPELRRPAGDVPEGWLVAPGVRISSAVLNAPSALARLAPRLNTATRLEGGLQIARGQYLVGGEPDLWITVGAGESCDVTIDGHTERFQPGVLPLRLSENGLPPGRHVIVAGGVTRIVTTTPGFPVVAAMGTGRFGHEFARYRSYRPRTEIAGPLPSGPPPSGTVRLSGAILEGNPDDLPLGPLPPILLRTGFCFLLLGARPGEILEVPSPARPEWLTDLHLDAQFFDCPAPFPIEWSLQQGQWGGKKVSPVRQSPSPPLRDQEIGVTAAVVWARAVVEASDGHQHSADTAKTWNEYVEVAEAILSKYELP